MRWFRRWLLGLTGPPVPSLLWADEVDRAVRAAQAELAPYRDDPHALAMEATDAANFAHGHLLNIRGATEAKHHCFRGVAALMMLASYCRAEEMADAEDEAMGIYFREILPCE